MNAGAILYRTKRLGEKVMGWKVKDTFTELNGHKAFEERTHWNPYLHIDSAMEIADRLFAARKLIMSLSQNSHSILDRRFLCVFGHEDFAQYECGIWSAEGATRAEAICNAAYESIMTKDEEEAEPEEVGESTMSLMLEYYKYRNLKMPPDAFQALAWAQTELAEAYELLLQREGGWKRNNPSAKEPWNNSRFAEELGDAIMMIVVAGHLHGVDPIVALEEKIKDKLHEIPF